VRNLIVTGLMMLTLAGGAVLSVHAQTPAMQPGVSVQMAVTTGAAQLPDADNPDAWVVTITANGHLYFGQDSETPESLLQAMKNRPRNRGQALYVKADSRAPFASVKQVLEAAHALFDRAYLLTAQPTGAQPGSVVPPTGLPISIAAAPTAGAVVVYISPGEGSPKLRIANEDVPLKTLQRKLVELLPSPNDRVVLLKAGQVPFADVVHVVDECNMAGAVTVVGSAEL